MFILIKSSKFAMSLEHSSHEHPLILKEKLDARGDDEIVCYGCQNPIIRGSAVYTCSSDNFYLHKTCAELPKEIEHLMHEQHPLTLHAHPPYENFSCNCNVCDRSHWKWFTYSCIRCHFDSCVTCADSCVTCAEDRVFRHIGHEQHALTLLTRSARFMCDACGTKATDFSYSCNSCQFWMHKSCASSPTTVQPNFHHHPLILTYSLPYIHRSFPHYCGICNKMVYEIYWVYYCSKCTYFVHIKCALLESGEKEEDNIEIELQRDDVETNLVQFPVSCKKSLTNLIIDQFAKGIINLEEAGEAAAAAPVPQTINHWTHRDHPLILLEELQSSENDNEMLLLLCNGCVQPVSTAQQFYGRMGCNFFLHRFCAELPIELPTGAHSCHPQHPLVLRMNENKFNFVRCNACGLYTNGLLFECEECDIRFDIGCCFLPNRIKHESHKHPLVNCTSPSSMFACSACGSDWSYDLFKCEITTCSRSFGIHKLCALLPSIMKHRWDLHPIPLIYPPFFHEGLIYCEICEEEVDTNYWLYHCRECDQSFHTGCLCPTHNVKFGDKLVVGIHPHTLTFVRKDKRVYCRPFLCCSCGEECFFDYFYSFECANCDILLCVKCGLASSDL